MLIYFKGTSHLTVCPILIHSFIISDFRATVQFYSAQQCHNILYKK